MPPKQGWKSFFCCCAGPSLEEDEYDSLNMVIIDNHHTNNSSGTARKEGSERSLSNNGSRLDDDLDLDGSVTLMKKRSVSFAPAGYMPPPSPAIPTTEITSPLQRSRSIIKVSSFSSNPLSAKGKPPVFLLDDEGGEENGASGRGDMGPSNNSSNMFRNDDLL
jgi:hypothetical protein